MKLNLYDFIYQLNQNVMISYLRISTLYYLKYLKIRVYLAIMRIVVCSNIQRFHIGPDWNRTDSTKLDESNAFYDKCFYILGR